MAWRASFAPLPGEVVVGLVDVFAENEMEHGSLAVGCSGHFGLADGLVEAFGELSGALVGEAVGFAVGNGGEGGNSGGGAERVGVEGAGVRDPVGAARAVGLVSDLVEQVRASDDGAPGHASGEDLGEGSEVRHDAFGHLDATG